MQGFSTLPPTRRNKFLQLRIATSRLKSNFMMDVGVNDKCNSLSPPIGMIPLTGVIVIPATGLVSAIFKRGIK